MKKTTYFVWSLALIGMILACIAYPFAQNDIPIHWNAQGLVDGYAPKWAIFFLPWVTPLLDLFINGCRRLDPKRANYLRFEPTYQIIRILMASFSFLFFLAAIIEIFQPGLIDIETFPMCLVGVIISTLGNVMPKVKPNFFVGIRTPWTLMNEAVWIKTHRVGGRAWFVGGFLFIIMALIPESTFLMLPLMIMIIIVYPVFYSYIIYRKYMQKGERK